MSCVTEKRKCINPLSVESNKKAGFPHEGKPASDATGAASPVLYQGIGIMNVNAFIVSPIEGLVQMGYTDSVGK